MTKIRSPKQSSKYYLPKEEFLTIVHFCKQYPYWLSLLDTMTDAVQGIDYEKDIVQSSNNYDSTSELGMKRAAVSTKVDMVNAAAREIAGDHYRWLILGCCFDKPYFALRHLGIPYGKNLYYRQRRQFYYELSKKI